MGTVIAARTVVAGDGLLSPGAVTVEGGRVTDVSAAVPDGAEIRPGYLVPGFVDLHCHGGGGASVGDGQDAVATAARTHLGHGTTSLGVSLVSAPRDRLLSDVAALAELVQDGLVAGTHVEGPWIAPAMRGAHDPGALRPPDPDEVGRVLRAARGTLHMVTLAPELEHGLAAVRRLADAGVLAAIGHTDADHEQARAGIAAGATVATHLFNQMRPVHHREPGPVPALLADARVHVELVADGVHLHPAVVALVRQAVPPERVVLVTDAMAAAGASDGRYLLGGLEVEVERGVARLRDGGALAGSTLTMDEAFRRVVTECGFSVADAVLATSTNPARLLRRDDIGTIAAGRRADLVHLDEDLTLRQVWHGGQVVPAA